MASQPTGSTPFGNPPPGQSFGPGPQGQPLGPPDQPTKKGMGWGTCLIGCLGIMLVSFVICAGFLYYAFVKFPDIARSTINNLIEESPMPAEDKKIVTAQVDRVVDEYKAGKITLQQVVTVLQKLGESPLFPLVIVFAAEENYVKPSMLPDEEKAAAKQTLQRVARGVFEKKIHQEEVERLQNHISTKLGNSRQFKEKISDEELRAFLADCKKTADDAMIPDEPFEVKIGEEFKKAVDEALGVGGEKKE